VFHPEHWAEAFINALGADAEKGLACLKALIPPVKSVHGALFGRTAARELERLLRDGAKEAGFSGREAEYAIRFTALLIEKNQIERIDLIASNIEKRLDKLKGVLEITAESAAPMDKTFEENLRKQIQEKTGAADVKLSARIVPEILGGYRLRIGGLCIDASLKGQLAKMAEELGSW
jgi:F0F1-type ATP synthase delta subunit